MFAYSLKQNKIFIKKRNSLNQPQSWERERKNTKVRKKLLRRKLFRYLGISTWKKQDRSKTYFKNAVKTWFYLSQYCNIEKEVEGGSWFLKHIGSNFWLFWKHFEITYGAFWELFGVLYVSCQPLSHRASVKQF